MIKTTDISYANISLRNLLEKLCLIKTNEYSSKPTLTVLSYDPRQTHALLGVKNEELDFYKNKLKELGAYKFSKVKIDENTTTLCFSAEKISEYKKMLKTV
jgi:hypothetical protein